MNAIEMLINNIRLAREVKQDTIIPFDVSYIVLNALQEKLDREKQPQPLTLEQLREMGGCPAWVKWLDGHTPSGWEIIGKSIPLPHDDEDFRYAETWLAYATKPGQIKSTMTNKNKVIKRIIKAAVITLLFLAVWFAMYMCIVLGFNALMKINERLIALPLVIVVGIAGTLAWEWHITKP